LECCFVGKSCRQLVWLEQGFYYFLRDLIICFVFEQYILSFVELADQKASPLAQHASRTEIPSTEI
jgi:hypothetical protein